MLIEKKLRRNNQLSTAPVRVIEVRGCFWHRHSGCKIASTPKSNTSYWQEKFQRNTQRDKENDKALVKEGWNLIIFWECETTQPKKMARLIQKLNSQKTHFKAS